MEESSSSFSAIFNAKKSTLCLHEAEIEITNGKCFIRGQAAFLREECPTGISSRSFSEENGAKCSDFIIPREVHVDEVGAATSMLSWLLLLHILTVPPAPDLLTPPLSTLRKSPTRKSVSRHPFFRMLTL
ncbi:hypothetical protein Peur_062315 [Populus x canadensis]